MHVEGLLWKLVRASMTIVGLVPPVTENGELLIDGGYLNNMPVDVMRGLGVDTVSSRSCYQLTHLSVSTDSLILAALAERDVEELFSASGPFSNLRPKSPSGHPRRTLCGMRYALGGWQGCLVLDVRGLHGRLGRSKACPIARACQGSSPWIFARAISA